MPLLPSDIIKSDTITPFNHKRNPLDILLAELIISQETDGKCGGSTIKDKHHVRTKTS